MNFNYLVPTKIIFGRGRIDELPVQAKKLGKKPFIVTSLKGLEILDKIIEIIEGSKIHYSLYDDVTMNPRSTDIDYAASICKEEGCDYIIGIGGGSSLDFAKGVAVSVGHDKSVLNFLASTKKCLDTTESTYKILAIPTTAGSSSEVTHGAVITNPDTFEKTWIASEFIMPKIAIVDPMLYISAPKIVTSGCGMDVLAHAVETFVSNTATPFSDLFSSEAIKITMQYLPKVVTNGNDINAREKMAFAATLVGFSTAHVGVILVHGMGHSLGGRLDMPHGIAMGLCLAPVIQFCSKSNIKKFAKLAELLGIEKKDLSEDELANSAAIPIKEMLKKIDLDLKLSDFGLNKNMIEILLDDIFGYLKDGFLPTTPRPVNRDDVRKLFMSIL